ncbi:MAG: DNA internalization-related competence protein ComEC/Rec2 [Gemmatimonadaceae bacterium]
MPLIAAAVVAYAAGLLLGFGGAPIPTALAAGASLALAALYRARAAAALLLLLLAGVAAARAAAARDAECVLRAARVPAWPVALDDEAAPGGYARGTLAAGDCRLRVALFVASGRAPAGRVVAVRGVLLPVERGAIVREAAVGGVAGRAPLVALRAAAGRGIDRAFGADSALARALLVADTRSLSPELRDRFAAAGLVHVLSISGLHVAVIAGALLLLFRAARLPVGAASAAAVAATTLYVAVIGAPPPAVRAGVMLGAAAAARALQRPTSPWASLALGAALPLLLDPRTVLDLGFQLSVAGMAALAASGALARRVLAPRLDGWRLKLARELLASTVATVVTAPLVAWSIGRVSVVAPLTNLVAAPLVTVLQPTLFLALLAAPAPALARFVAGAAHPLLALLDATASAGSSIPHASIAVAPTVAGAVLAAGAAGAFVVACVSRFPARPLAVALACAALAAWAPWRAAPARDAGAVELHMLDVGQGDALALRTPRGRWIVFDAGRAWAGGDAGRTTLVPYLRREGGDVVAFVLSHPHADHVGGAATLIGALRPAAYWDAAFAAGSEVYRGSLEAARRAGVPWRRVHPGDSLVVDGVAVRFLAPDSSWTAALTDPNLASTVALVRYGAVRFLLVGDAERPEEEWLLAHAGADALRADVLKVAHHGSRTSSTSAFLDAVRPRVALVSVGAANSYGLPSPEVMADLAARGAEVLRTDRLGAVVVRTDGQSLTISAGGATWQASTSSASSGASSGSAEGHAAGETRPPARAVRAAPSSRR